MKNYSLSLFCEINNSYFTFSVGKNNEQNNCEIIFTHDVPINGIQNNRIENFEKVFTSVKENIFFLEQKYEETFKEVILILENSRPSFINLTGFKKLNGSQVLRENITYIINNLKSYVDEIELKKKIIHIFNSNFSLDNKKIENLPIGLFGDFYSHELSFVLIKNNDYKNLKNIFDKCNIKIKKIFLNSFIKGAYLSDKNHLIETFFQLEIKESESKIFYFENNSLKYEQNFKFGTNIIIKDIAKVTSLNIEIVKKIINQMNFKDEFSNDELIEEEFFKDDVYKKIKKKLIYEIAIARIHEIVELMILKNINICHYINLSKILFIDLNKKSELQSLNSIFKEVLSKGAFFDVEFLEDCRRESILSTAYRLVHFGWKKEAIPITQSKKSLIARFFDTIFG